MGILDFFRSQESANSPPPPIPSLATPTQVSEVPTTVTGPTPDEIREQLASLQEQISEYGETNQALAQQAEDLAWTVIGQFGQTHTNEISFQSRKRRNETAEKAWREDPVLARAIEVFNDYVWGGGMPIPSARDPRVDRIIKSFWDDEDNKLVLTSYEAQLQKGIELRLFGELFLLVYDQGRWGDLGIRVTRKPKADEPSGPQPGTLLDTVSQITESGNHVNHVNHVNGNGQVTEVDFTGGGGGASAGGAAFAGFGSMTSGGGNGGSDGGEDRTTTYIDDLSGGAYKVVETGPIPPSAVKLGQLHPNEVTDVIPDQKNRLRPRYYKQIVQSFKYDYKNGTYVPLTPPPGAGQASTNMLGQRVLYYESLQFPPRPDQDSPDDSQVGLGRIIHVAVNKTSFSLRGNSEVWRAVKWAQALQDYFQWRLTMLKALATFPLKRKVKGGVSAVTQAALRLTQINRNPLSAPLNTSSTDPFVPPPVGSILTENQNESLEQFKVDTGASNAREDILALRSQVGVGLGLPPHYIGDVGSANLANATQMEVPVLKTVESRQELFRRVVNVILNHCIEKAIADGVIPDDVDRTIKLDMPNILARNVPLLVNAITQVAARLDPFALDMKLKRWMFSTALVYLGVADPKAIVDQVYPPGAQPLVPMLTSTSGTAQSFPGAKVVPSPGQNLKNTPGTKNQPDSNPPELKNKKLQAQPIEKVRPATEAEVNVGDEGDVSIEDMSPEEQIKYMQALKELVAELEKIGVSAMGLGVTDDATT